MSVSNDGKVRRPHISLARSTTKGDAEQRIELLSSSPRRGKRSKEDSGLPDDAELKKLARAYLEAQRRLWPRIMAEGHLPEPTEIVLADMVADFKRRHREGTTACTPLKVLLKFCTHLAGSYSRFSCEHSDPKSIIDQLVTELERARHDDRFVPWQYVFCDYSVSGFDSSRQGYTSYKKILTSREHLIETTYIDDFSRASREELEWWKLASISRKHRKRLIGASDNFTLDDSFWEIRIKLYALFSALFKISLQQKVRRGMRGSFREGGVVGKLILGHGRSPRRDENGNVLCRPNGKAKTTRCIDPKGERYKRLMYRLFLERNWSRGRIARAFNKKKVDGWDGWTAKSIDYELTNPANLGIFIWNQYCEVYNYEEEKFEREENPRSEWEFYFDKSLALVPIAWWKKARRKIAKIKSKDPRTGKPRSRNQSSATTLFSGTLFCADCYPNAVGDGAGELKLYRSQGKHKQLACLNGAHRKHGCTLTASKSTGIIESCVLGFLLDGLVTEERLHKLLTDANDYVERQARKPKVNLRPKQSREKALAQDIQKLMDRIKGCTNEKLCKAYDEEIARLQTDLDDVRAEIHEARQRNAPPPPPLKLERINDYLADTRALLNQDIPAAAELIRAFTGPILISQEPSAGKGKGAKWFAKFSPDLLRLLATIGRKRKYPEMVTLENLLAANWILPDEVRVEIDSVPAHIVHQAEILRLMKKKIGRRTIATALGIGVGTVDAAVNSHNGKPPRERHRTPCTKGNTKTKRSSYRDISPEVARRADILGDSIKKIAKDLGYCEPMVRRAYDHAHPEIIAAAIESGDPPKRSAKAHALHARRTVIDDLIRSGIRTCDIIRQTGCCRPTVEAARKRLAKEVVRQQPPPLQSTEPSGDQRNLGLSQRALTS